MAAASFKFKNPLEENSAEKTPEPCILVIFGATGDLTARKLIPALYNLMKDGALPAHFACVGFARRAKSDAAFREEMQEAIVRFSRTQPLDAHIWKQFSEALFYHRSEFDSDEGYDSLKILLEELDAKMGTKGNRLYYLSVQPSYFAAIIENLKKHGLIYNAEKVHDKWSRVIIEKPFGHDLASAQSLQADIAKYLDERQIYRIDHYLGKETVQNLLVFRFSNPLFESLWNNRHIDHIQITVSEEIGIGSRGRFFEEAGMLRDIVQNHMMQLLSLVAMEPPSSLQASKIHDEKIKVLEAIRPFVLDALSESAERGQYAKGFINGSEVLGYREEDNVSPSSFVETYVALKLYIDNWRWAGVPFYLRAGKRLPKRATEIAIIFKDAPGFLFQKGEKNIEQNVLAIRIQPDEGISLKMNCKVPGLTSPIQPVKMDFRYGEYFGQNPPEAYERLICDAMAGDATLFTRADEVMSSWRLLTPLLENWAANPSLGFSSYSAGTWGPESADRMIRKDGRQWRIL